MGHLFKINDTLKLSGDAILPEELHEGYEFKFSLPGIRFLNLSPSRVFLVNENNKKWDYRGHGQITQLTMNPETNTTEGICKVVVVYPADYRALTNKFEPPKSTL